MKKLALNILILSSFSLWAQPDDENLGQFELSVTDRYKAQVMDARKILERPSYKDSINQKLAVDYQIFSTPISVKMQPDNLKPARIAKIEVPELYKGYVRLGYGMYNTGLVEAYYNSGRSSKQSYGFSARHLSSKDGVEDRVFDDNGFSRNHIEGFYNRYYRKFTWHTSAQVDLDKFTYYGSPVLGLSTNEDSARGVAPYNWYRTYSIRSSIKEALPQYLGWMEELALEARHFDDNYQSQEQDFQLKTDWVLPAGSQDLNLDLNFAYFQNSIDSLYPGINDTVAYDQSTFQFQARPNIHLEREDYSFDFGLNLYILDQQDSRPNLGDGRIFFFPELILNYKLVPGVLRIKAGIKGELQRNTFQDLSQLSPFLAPGQLTRAGGENRLFAAMEGILASNLGFSLEGGYQAFRNRAFLYTNPSGLQVQDQLFVNVRYQDIDVYYAKGALDFNWQEKLLAKLSATARSFSPRNNGEQAWYLPYFEAQLSTRYNLRDKIGLQLALDYIGARRALDQRYPNYEPLLEPYVDLGLKIDYRYNSRIGAFVSASNLLNSQYDILLGYRAQSVGVIFGLNYRF